MYQVSVKVLKTLVFFIEEKFGCNGNVQEKFETTFGVGFGYMGITYGKPPRAIHKLCKTARNEIRSSLHWKICANCEVSQFVIVVD
jgi:hypothetical protein